VDEEVEEQEQQNKNDLHDKQDNKDLVDPKFADLNTSVVSDKSVKSVN